MTYRHLEIFVTVAECGKMNEAAKRLFITQSSVSQAIAEIERQYDVLLFERMSKHLYLTEVGQSFLSYAKKILALYAETVSYLSFSAKNKRIRIGATITVGTCLISDILTTLKERYPDIRAEVLVANTHIIEEKLLSNELDVGLVEGVIKAHDLKVCRAIDDQLVMICSMTNKFFGRKSVSIYELADEPMIMREKGSGTRAQLEQQAKELHIPLDIIWDCYNTEAILDGVIAGHGIAVISKRLVEESFRNRKLWMCDIEDLNLDRTFDLVIHKDKMNSDALDAFCSIAMERGKKEH